MRIEAAAAGIRVSVLCPGFVRTPMLDGTGKSGKLVTARPLEQLLDEIEKVRPIAADAFARKALDAIKELRRWGEKVTLPWMTDAECQAVSEAMAGEADILVVEEGETTAAGRRRLSLALRAKDE